MLSLEEALRLMIDHRNMIARELKLNGQLDGGDGAYSTRITEG
jgi:hypothetical protein